MSGAGTYSAIEGATAWAVAVLLGSIATALAILAVAVFGMMMLNGAIDVRRGLRVVLGCFLLFGAPAIAAAFMAMAGASSPPLRSAETQREPPPTSEPVDDPYAGAALPSRR